MTKYVCTVCGYIAEGSIPEFCPVCKAPASKFIEKKELPSSSRRKTTPM